MHQRTFSAIRYIKIRRSVHINSIALSARKPDIYIYSILRVWIKRAARSLFTIENTFLGHMTNREQLGSHMTNREHFSRDAFRVCRVTQQTATEQTTNTATVLCFVCIGTTPLAVFVDASSLIGDTKRLRLPRFDGYLSVNTAQCSSLFTQAKVT